VAWKAQGNGRPGEEILAAGKGENTNRVADVMMGSTADRVLQRSRKPVRIVRRPEGTG